MGVYSATGLSTNMENGTKNTALNLFNTITTFRPRITRFAAMPTVHGADNAVEIELLRTTAVGTEGAGVVPAPTDPGDPAAGATDGAEAHTVEPTFTAASEMWHGFINQRSGIELMYAPGDELVLPATANNGFGIRGQSVSYASPLAGILHVRQ